MIPKCKKWKVLYLKKGNAKSGIGCYVYAVNRRFALWNARDYIGFPAPGSKVTASIVKNIQENS
jgi:hypothetical protein